MLPSPSIVVEWETGQECGGDRASACLAELNRQMWEEAGSFQAPPELILVFDPLEAEPAAVDRAAAAAAPQGWPGRFEIAAAPGRLDYYQKKNFGFARSRGEIVLFVDSDLAPERGWLGALLAPFADPSKSVVVGRTHFETGSLYERAVALFWIFEERLSGDEVRPTRRLVSNNIAFRRRVFAALPFPDRPTYRGQCSELGGKLGELGIVMYEATAARAVHPAPAGLGPFVRRAWNAGRDGRHYAASEGRRSAARILRRDLAGVAGRIRARRRPVGAGPASVAAAALMGLAYYSVKASAWLIAPPYPAASAGR